jgi:hypothetical protein
MSEENQNDIVDVEAQHVIEFTNADFPEEKTRKDGMNIPDPVFIDETTPEGMQAIEERRQDVANLPEFPSEWQQDYKDENTKGFDDDLKIRANVSFKQQEMNKLIKKYKRYMKSNITEVRRLGS